MFILLAVVVLNWTGFSTFPVTGLVHQAEEEIARKRLLQFLWERTDEVEWAISDRLVWIILVAGDEELSLAVWYSVGDEGRIRIHLKSWVWESTRPVKGMDCRLAGLKSLPRWSSSWTEGVGRGKQKNKTKWLRLFIQPSRQGMSSMDRWRQMLNKIWSSHRDKTNAAMQLPLIEHHWLFALWYNQCGISQFLVLSHVILFVYAIICVCNRILYMISLWSEPSYIKHITVKAAQCKGWRGFWEHDLLFWMTKDQLCVSRLTPACKSVPGDWTASPGLCGQCTHIHKQPSLRVYI